MWLDSLDEESKRGTGLKEVESTKGFKAPFGCQQLVDIYTQPTVIAASENKSLKR